MWLKKLVQLLNFRQPFTDAELDFLRSKGYRIEPGCASAYLISNSREHNSRSEDRVIKYREYFKMIHRFEIVYGFRFTDVDEYRTVYVTKYKTLAEAVK